MPVETTKTKIIFGFICCMRGSINVRIRLDRGGYVPGEIMILHVEVDNQSRTRLISSTVSLIEVIFMEFKYFCVIYVKAINFP